MSAGIVKFTEERMGALIRDKRDGSGPVIPPFLRGADMELTRPVSVSGRA